MNIDNIIVLIGLLATVLANFFALKYSVNNLRYRLDVLEKKFNKLFDQHIFKINVFPF